MAKPCECPTQSDALRKNCHRMGLLMVGVPWELCSQNCPAERPCSAEDSEKFRELCDSVPRQQPQSENLPSSLAKRLILFAAAMHRWSRAGKPKFKSQETIDKRVATCKACPFFHDNICGHSACGCDVESRKILGVVRKPGKAELPGETCPVGKWPKLLGSDIDGWEEMTETKKRKIAEYINIDLAAENK